MTQYIFKRIFQMIPTLFVISLISFAVIQLPPGDYLTTQIMNLKAMNIEVSGSQLDSLRENYGFDQPLPTQYFKWITRFLTGDMGQSFASEQPVSKLIGERIGLTVAITFLSLAFTWCVALPLGVYSATHKYRFGDYFLTLVGFLGMAIPDFLLALGLMYIFYAAFGWSVGGLFSPNMINAPWSPEKFIDLLKHIWIPIVVLGMSAAAGTIRIMRSNMLDELNQPYVTAARSRGLKESTLIWRYPVRIALNPFLSTLGWMLPTLISGSEIVAIVLNLPTTGPLLLGALRAQDMYLAAGILMILSILTVIGTLLSDILLAYVDPRIRYEN
jgi:peptide/nickel transport system permease protein